MDNDHPAPLCKPVPICKSCKHYSEHKCIRPIGEPTPNLVDGGTNQRIKNTWCEHERKSFMWSVLNFCDPWPFTMCGLKGKYYEPK